MIKRLAAIPLALFIQTIDAQPNRPDTLFLAKAATYQQSLYDNTIRGQLRLYNGTEYRDYLSRDEEHPYFGIDDWQYGSVIYDDERYDSVAMFYDISRDQVVTEHRTSGSKIELIARKIAFFTISGHPFVRLNADPVGVISEGFYERLYNGKTTVFARHTKQINSRAEANTIEYFFDERTRYYIYKDNIYYPIKSKRAALRAFGTKRVELKSMLRKEKIKFRRDRQNALVKMARTHDAID